MKLLRKTGVGTLNRAEQTYHFERQTFAPALDDVALEANNVLGVIVASDDFTFVKDAGDATTVTISAEGTDATTDGVRTYTGRTSFDAAASVLH